MQTVSKLLILVGLGAALSGCVVAPYGHPRAYVAVPAVVVHPGYYGPRYYGPHYYYGPRYYGPRY